MRPVADVHRVHQPRDQHQSADTDDHVDDVEQRPGAEYLGEDIRVAAGEPEDAPVESADRDQKQCDRFELPKQLHCTDLAFLRSARVGLTGASDYCNEITPDGERGYGALRDLPVPGRRREALPVEIAAQLRQL